MVSIAEIRAEAEPYDVVIVGAGPAGLAAAWKPRGSRTLVLETAAHPGDYFGEVGNIEVAVSSGFEAAQRVGASGA